MLLAVTSLTKTLVLENNGWPRNVENRQTKLVCSVEACSQY